MTLMPSLAKTRRAHENRAYVREFLPKREPAFAAVVKYDDAVAQHASALLGVTGDNPGGQVIGRRPLRTSRLVLTHCFLRC